MVKKVDWYYMRGGWTTCTKASKFLEAKNIQIKETVSANKKLQEKHARALLKAANSLIAAKGKKVEEFDTREKISKDSVAAMLGTTGNMRAPTIVAGKKLIVGFNEEVFEKAFG